MNIIRSLQYQILRRKLESQPRERHFCTWDEAHRVLLLFQSDSQEQNTIVRQIISDIKNEGKEVVAIGYVDKKRAETASIDWLIMLDRSSVDFLGAPRIEKIASKLDGNYDIIIDLTPSLIIPLHYMFFFAEHTMRCGKQDVVRHNIYDFVITLPSPPVDEETGLILPSYSEASSLYHSIIDYLRVIRSK